MDDARQLLFDHDSCYYSLYTCSTSNALTEHEIKQLGCSQSVSLDGRMYCIVLVRDEMTITND